MMSPDKITQWDKIQSHFESYNGDSIADFIAKSGDVAKTAMIQKNGLTMLGTFEAMDDLTSAIPVILLDDQSIPTDATSELMFEKKKAWNTTLYYLNLIQFATKSHVAVSSNIDSLLPSEAPQPEVSDAEWDDVFELTLKVLHPALASLREGQVPAPIVGYELFVGTRVLAEAELAWEDKKIAVANQDHISEFENENWRVYVVEDIIENPKINH